MPYHQFTVTVPEPFTDRLVQALMSSGSLGVIDRGGSFIAYFAPEISAAEIIVQLDVLKALLGASNERSLFSYSYALIPDEDWNASWKRGFQPLDVGDRFTVLPPWEQHRTGRIALVIDPGMAFGTGHHETTRSCLVLMDRCAGRTGTGRFLDLGTGTGLLAIAARKIGFREVLAIDTDPLAVDAARKNCELNGTTDVTLIQGTIADAAGRFDMIAANLIAGTLIELSGALAERLERSGTAICSGILKGQDDEVVEAMARAGLGRCERLPDGKWVSLALSR